MAISAPAHFAPDATVMVVDGDAGRRRQVADWLRAAGFSVLLAGDGKEALASLSRTPVQLVISSIQMPHVDGLELLRALQAVRPRPPAIMVAAGQSDIDHIYCRSAKALGAAWTAAWPIQRPDLMEKVQALLA